MIYIGVTWKQTNPEFPVKIYIELDADRWERRKIEIFDDGRTSYVCNSGRSGSASLGLEPVPDIDTIRQNKEFEVDEIAALEFEKIWNMAVQNNANL